MAEGKKSFVLYTDLIYTVDKLSNEEAGELFKHILNYVNDKNPETNNRLIELSFEGVKQQLKRDLKKYEDRAKRSRTNGAKGGRPPKPSGLKSKPKKPSGLNQNPEEPRKPDSDNVNVNVNDNVNVTVNDSSLKKNQRLVGAFLEFKKMRDKIRRPLTERAEELIWNDLRKLSKNEDTQIKILEQSIKNGWQGVFPLDKKQSVKPEVLKVPDDFVPSKNEKLIEAFK